MKIELWYDPVYTETRVRVNGHWQEENDIYSFLYPVLQYPLQTWLSKAGTWPGLIQQLTDLARGEKIELEFYGRNSDFNDLCSVVEGLDMLEFTFCPWDTLAICEEKVELVIKALREMKQEVGGDTVTERLMAGLLQKVPDETEWLVTIHSEKELHQAEKDDRICCAVLSNVLDSYERLEQIERLSRSLRRPMDAICCCFQDTLQRDAFARYAAQFPRLQYRFYVEEVPDWRKELWLKYGEASIKKKKLATSVILNDNAMIYLEQQKGANDNKRMELNNKKMRGELSHSGEKELDYCLKKATQIRGWQITWEKLKGTLIKHPIHELETRRERYE